VGVASSSLSSSCPGQPSLPRLRPPLSRLRPPLSHIHPATMTRENTFLAVIRIRWIIAERRDHRTQDMRKIALKGKGPGVTTRDRSDIHAVVTSRMELRFAGEYCRFRIHLVVSENTTNSGGVLGFRMTSPTTQELIDQVPDVSEIMEHRGHRLGLTTII